MFEQATPVSRVEAEIPIIGNCFYPSMPYPGLVRLVVDALLARERFKTERPDWPQLPLHKNDCARMTGSDDNRNKLVGFFGDSLRHALWEDHPGFGRYCQGLMAYEYAPRKLRSDPELQKQFPATELEGLCGGWLNWRSPKTIAEHRRVGFKPPMRKADLGLAWSAPLDQ